MDIEHEFGAMTIVLSGNREKNNSQNYIRNVADKRRRT